MAPWLTFVIGVIAGLVIGWLLDMIYRRAPRPEATEQPVSAPNWTQPLAAPTPAPELAGVAAASTAAAAVAADDDVLDVPPGSETAEATEEVDWRAISARVDEVAEGLDDRRGDAPEVGPELPGERGLPPAAADTLAPDDEDPSRRI